MSAPGPTHRSAPTDRSFDPTRVYATRFSKYRSIALLHRSFDCKPQPIATRLPDHARRHIARRRPLEHGRYVVGPYRHHHTRGRFAEQRRRMVQRLASRDANAVNRHLGADTAAVERRFGNGNGETAIRAVVRRPQQTLVCRSGEKGLKHLLGLEIDRRRPAANEIVRELQVLAPAQLAVILPKQQDDVTAVLKSPPHDAIGVLQQADDADDRCRVNRTTIGLVVEAHIAASNRHVERAARRPDALDRFRELPHDRRPLRVAEVEAVCRSEGSRPGTRHISRSLGDGEHRAAVRIQVAVASVAVD